MKTSHMSNLWEGTLDSYFTLPTSVVTVIEISTETGFFLAISNHIETTVLGCLRFRFFGFRNDAAVMSSAENVRLNSMPQ